MENDWDFVETMEHGMPPATGTGIGIDRFTALLLVSLYSNSFPLMKPKKTETEDK